jgi:hypothetical protein
MSGLARVSRQGEAKYYGGVVMIQTVKVHIVGEAPLLMHSCIGVNPLHPLTLEKKKYTAKRKKTEEDHLKIMDIDFLLGLYWEEGIGPYIPAVSLEACIKEAAKRTKNGKNVTRALQCSPDFMPLQYQGPREKEELLKDMRFRDVRVGKIGQSSVVICRPRFDHWAVDAEISFDTEIFEKEMIFDFLELAGRMVGLCDYRPRYGRFSFQEV